MDKATNDSALDMFYQVIRAAGGDPDALRAEIGPVRFGDRMREFFGKGDTLNQSGKIQIGNGMTMNSLRSLQDFGQGGSPAGQTPVGTGGAANVAPGPNAPPPGGGGGGRGGGGGGGGFLGFFEKQLRDLFGGGFGIDEDTANAQRAALTSASNRNQQGAFSSLAAQMNAAGGLGGGRHGALGQLMSSGFQENLLDQLAGFDMGLNQLQLQDRQAAFGAGNQFAGTRVNQQLGLGDIGARNYATQVQQQLGQGGLDLQRLLGLGNIDLQRELGLGQLGLGQGQLNLSQQLGMGNLGLQQNNQQFNQGLQTFLANLGLFGGGE